MATMLPEALKRFKENYPDFKPDNVRLIDANALLSHLQGLMDGKIIDYDGFKCNEYECGPGLRSAMEALKSAHTVDISELQEKAWKYDELCK